MEIETRPPGQFGPIDPLDLLVVAPHPDDAELGMGGTILKCVQDGMRVGILDLTTGEPTPHGSETRRRHETLAATEILQPTWRGNAGMTNRFLEPTIENRGRLAEYLRVLRPRWLFSPFPNDAHPDHVAASALVRDARFWAKLSKIDLAGERYHPQRIFHYFCIHLRQAIRPDFIVDISDHWGAKRESIEAYESQFVTGREDLKPTMLERFEIDNAYWGTIAATRYGEPFAASEPLAVRSLGEFL